MSKLFRFRPFKARPIVNIELEYADMMFSFDEDYHQQLYRFIADTLKVTGNNVEINYKRTVLKKIEP